jgi:aminoglycoside phosphotransferase (APT) family kinase protein
MASTFSAAERHASVMATTPRQVINSVVRSVCGREVERIVALTGGGLNETYRVDLAPSGSAVTRIARQPVPWFTDEEHVMAQARAVGVPTPEVLGVEHVEHDGELLSFSIQRLLPGRSLDELASELPPSDVERLVMDGGELLARVHSVPPGRGIRHELQPPDERVVARLARVVHQEFGPAAAAVVERGADLLREQVTTRPAPRLSLAHGDWMPKHLLIDDEAIVGVLDWELAGPASPAFDLARWEVSAAGRPHHGSALLRRGYARVVDPDTTDAGWVPAFAIDWAFEVLGWKNPARPAYRRRCVDVVARYAGT